MRLLTPHTLFSCTYVSFRSPWDTQKREHANQMQNVFPKPQPHRQEGTPNHSTAACAFRPTCIFPNTNKFTIIPEEDQNPSTHTYAIFFHTQCRQRELVLIPRRNQTRIFSRPTINTIPIALSCFFF